MFCFFQFNDSGEGNCKNIVQKVVPDPESSSFQKPISDMNEAFGCPQFAPLSVLNDLHYINNDVMFLKCEVDLTNIVHP